MICVISMDGSFFLKIAVLNPLKKQFHELRKLQIERANTINYNIFGVKRY